MKNQQNMSAVAFLRVSSHRQTDNTSHDTQEQEVLKYASENALEIVQVFRLTESAKDSAKRTQYQEGLKWALKNKVRHVLFYIFDRETRNLTDNERNESLVRSGAMVIHYVKERRIYHSESSDSDFFLRDVQAVTNKQFVRQLRTKVMDAQRMKAESGWFPGNKPPLGYVHARQRDSEGRELKRGTVIAIDPNERNVRQVQREFELRALGFSAEQIRERVIQEGFISPLKTHKYFKSAVERRIRNRFYWGEFEWQDVTYKGKHELIIPQHILNVVESSVNGGGYQRRVVSDHGLFGGGWLKCGDQTCGCHIVYDPKTKNIVSTGEKKTFHYYHCTNGRKVHAGIKNVSEEKLWLGLGQAVSDIEMPDEFAQMIAGALNDTHQAVRRKRREEIAGFRGCLAELEAAEDAAYADLRKGLLDDRMYQRQIAKVREERGRYTSLLETANEDLDSAYLETAQSILELAKDAKALWLGRSAQERFDFLKTILSNQWVDGLTVRYELKKPFALLKEMKVSGEWRPLVDRFRTACMALAA